MIGQQIIQIHEVDSTNNYAAKLLLEGKLSHGTVILAEYQTAGRGQRGRNWQSSAAKQFTGTYFLKTDFLSVDHLCYLNMCVALSVRELIQSYTKKKVSIKWPNDIFIENQKIAGILIETNWKNGRVEGAIVGIGINISPVQSVLHATSLEEISGKSPETLNVLDFLSRYLNEFYEHLQHAEFDYLKKRYESFLWNKDLEITMEERQDTVPFQGIIRGVDQIGNLLVEKNGIVTVYHNQELNFEANYGRIIPNA
ncbi:biotin--[acetyl-CoA-carboxylase] ligase [Fluviicola taffensis]|uniref:Biotin/acetyl-CoA-carboxylase ligase n=1 Tax=Fluviicola taffensis (strain DSM 16823 / NCIMB 13979 / RW262) TaxID=755732 RepID=F2IFG1_FLUTR|nr:biotin--[acetyl-CoA-carboxylase] ligase [Fluviicola taffensis]AEA44646.1 biotin/acetyl-CoA-carboxylase ligase [Fluviicola taffensis DSM 16823]